MNEKLIDNWNSIVSSKDIGYILGDFSFAKSEETVQFIRSMKCAQLHLILGNHDSHLKDWVRKEFDSCQHYLELKVPDDDTPRGQQNIVLCHFPMLTWNKSSHFSYMLHGHCHGTLKDQTGKRLDVGVDVHDFKPVSYEQVKAIMKTKDFVPSDRHGEREGEEHV